jgi:uncharacterized protein
MDYLAPVIGRKEEWKQLAEIVSGNRPEFIVLYGRRRVGKTFLIRQFFQNRFDFYLAGVANAKTEQQLFNFHTNLNNQSRLEFNTQPDNWLQAFQMLIRHIDSVDGKSRKIIFFDEMPWLDTKGSDFIMGLEHFWNSWASARADVVLIACGSAAAWMTQHLINNTGGLHNRVTRRMKISPFTLAETEALLQHRQCKLNRYQVVQLYMVLGGIPFYLDAVSSQLSATQNIQRLFFEKDGLLRNEFMNLYRSLFKKYQFYEKLVEVLASKTSGFQRSELAQQKGLASGGTLTRALADLEESGFISSYTDLNRKQKNTVYRLSDYYTAFYFRFIKDGAVSGPEAWMHLSDSAACRAWQGLAFEQVCMNHVPQIKKALGISGIISNHAAWRGQGENRSAQIDLLIDRRDDVINLCEAKFSINDVTITNDYAKELREKIGVFKEVSKTKKAVFCTFITTYGVNKNGHANQLVQNEVLMDDLFVP